MKPLRLYRPDRFGSSPAIQSLGRKAAVLGGSTEKVQPLASQAAARFRPRILSRRRRVRVWGSDFDTRIFLQAGLKIGENFERRLCYPAIVNPDIALLFHVPEQVVHSRQR